MQSIAVYHILYQYVFVYSSSLPHIFISLSLSYGTQKQVQDYIAWVNNYLRKRPRANLITDLRSGMQDGITLINLVEIAGLSRSLPSFFFLVL